MKRQYKDFFRRMMARHLRQYRKRNGLSQERMAERLSITPRSYADLEREKYCCSSLTVIRFLSLLEDDEALLLLHSIHKQIKEADQHGAA